MRERREKDLLERLTQEASSEAEAEDEGLDREVFECDCGAEA